MNSRIPNRQKAPENSDSGLVSSQFQPRPFTEVLKGMQNLVSTTRTELEVKYNAALQELSQSEQSALKTATQALNSQLQSIDQNLNTNLAYGDDSPLTFTWRTIGVSLCDRNRIGFFSSALVANTQLS